jgi:iron-sulfur cluster assembly protein CyaY
MPVSAAQRARERRRRLGIAAIMITDSDFIAAADRTLVAIGEALEVALDASDADLDWNLIDGILEIECGDGSKIIVNRHVPNREIWVAARTGGFHFQARDGVWRDSRSGGELAAHLGALLQAQCGLPVPMPALPAPAVQKSGR